MIPVPSLASFSIELTGGLITALFAGLTIGASGLAWILFKAHQIYAKLETGENNRQIKAVNEQDEIRETLLSRYKELYDLEKEEGSRARNHLRLALEAVQKEMAIVKESMTHKDSLVVDLQTINLSLQQENGKYKSEIESLRSEVKSLRDEVESFRQLRNK